MRVFRLRELHLPSSEPEPPVTLPAFLVLRSDGRAVLAGSEPAETALVGVHVRVAEQIIATFTHRLLFPADGPPPPLAEPMVFRAFDLPEVRRGFLCGAFYPARMGGGRVEEDDVGSWTASEQDPGTYPRPEALAAWE